MIREPAAVNTTEPAAETVPSAGMVRATSVIALGNVASRVLGLAREIILSHLFGAGVAVDAFNLAIIVPRGLYDLLIGGHVNSALV
ncbi:MAG: murein biosynthesis integral membrane protein MurJ, partial [Anaerolineae bacterium]|nr:murein biosynthesis integral membrane protein MurJ [Anaerolineae bacterium]